MTTIAIVQARMGSTRLPGKVLLKVNGRSLIEILLDRLSRAKRLDRIILATSVHPDNDLLAQTVEQLGYSVSRGQEDDVLSRYYETAKAYKPEAIVRVTADCPIIDPTIVDRVIELFAREGVDYASNTNPPTFPDGLDTEIFTFSALEQAYREASTSYDREHVTPFLLRNSKFKKTNLLNTEDLSNYRWTVDELPDLKVIDRIVCHFFPDTHFNWQSVLKLRESHPEYFLPNQHISRNEGTRLDKGLKLWKRAKNIIPGGNMLLSKRPEMFLPERWPAYYSKTKGCHVWDLDGKCYIDMSIMGIGTNILGYSHPEVDQSVRHVLGKGNMATFNCPEEVYLAERLIELHPWAEMVRLARSGGEANAIAIRIARAASGRDKVAICGYHGWHDWYLATNLGNLQNLDEHHLPGLDPCGVPRNLKNTVFPFLYNDYETLEKIVMANPEIGAIKMEVQRNQPPADNFLQKVRDLATKRNIILIFDECTSGFRETLGGLHKKYNIAPDMALFGKALGNGYAITTIIGKRSIMEAAQNTFISSTFWTERIGPSAALATLRVMENTRSWEYITKIGKSIGNNWQRLGEQHGLTINISGLPALIAFEIPVTNWLKYKTLITQEMLKCGILAANSVYVCTAHTPALVDEYLQQLDSVFSLIRDCEDGRSIDRLLQTPVCHSNFHRLN
ncbi:MAG: glutamate-1-semialdehyde aminotransferase [Acidiferrobacteraceae bacterium]|nr:glutamate-1-semialdehyde aminotransferase [Acidiferrobacteraceae bacterium]